MKIHTSNKVYMKNQSIVSHQNKITFELTYTKAIYTHYIIFQPPFQNTQVATADASIPFQNSAFNKMSASKKNFTAEEKNTIVQARGTTRNCQICDGIRDGIRDGKKHGWRNSWRKWARHVRPRHKKTCDRQFVASQRGDRHRDGPKMVSLNKGDENSDGQHDQGLVGPEIISVTEYYGVTN